MPRIRNWKDLTFFRHSDDVALLPHRARCSARRAATSSTGRSIEKHFPDLMRVAISIKEGRLELGDDVAQV